MNENQMKLKESTIFLKEDMAEIQSHVSHKKLARIRKHSHSRPMPSANIHETREFTKQESEIYRSVLEDLSEIEGTVE